MMNAKVLLAGSAICFVVSFFKPADNLSPVGFLMLVMSISIWAEINTWFPSTGNNDPDSLL